MATTGREIHLKRRPVGLPREDDFELVVVPIPDRGHGDVVVRNLYMSVDPYMRGRMIDRASYVPPFQVGQALEGGCVGQVIETQNSTFQEGDYVLSRRGWREYCVSDGTDLTRVDANIVPLPTYLGTMGMPGMTAYIGLLDLGRPQSGNTVFVSAAAGAVGSVVCQLAKLKGCRVVGSAGSAAKVHWLREVAQVDAAINYKEVTDLTSAVGQYCPQGIDIYFENVGGAHLEAALEHMNPFGRLVLCGMIAQYNATATPGGPGNLALAVRKRLTLQGFIVSDHLDRREQFSTDMAQWIQAGQIKWQETIVDGLENAPKAFIGLFAGNNLGKMLVRLAS